MALHKDFPASPLAILNPELRWFPADEALRSTSADRLMPPLVPLKMQRLQQWCEDLNRVQSAVKYDFVFVDQESFEKYKPTSFKQLIYSFKEYKPSSSK